MTETTTTTETEQPSPCQCMTSFAAISPTHHGHCCFVPATQTCHPEEVAEWERGMDRRWGPAMSLKCLCGDDDPDGCLYLNCGYEYCPKCVDHHRPPICVPVLRSAPPCPVVPSP